MWETLRQQISFMVTGSRSVVVWSESDRLDDEKRHKGSFQVQRRSALDWGGAHTDLRISQNSLNYAPGISESTIRNTHTMKLIFQPSSAVMLFLDLYSEQNFSKELSILLSVPLLWFFLEEKAFVCIIYDLGIVTLVVSSRPSSPETSAELVPPLDTLTAPLTVLSCRWQLSRSLLLCFLTIPGPLNFGGWCFSNPASGLKLPYLCWWFPEFYFPCRPVPWIPHS